jgi:fibronectin-binding autotransporter adhesin
VILGNFANSVTLLTGERITGNLDAGSPGAAALTLEGAGTQVLSQAVTGTIGGFFSLAKQGTGTWIIDEDLSHTGGATIASGTLQIGNGGTTGSIVGSVVDNGILAFNRSNTVTFGGTISGTGSVAVNGFGTLALTGTNTYTGGTNLNDGILAVATDSNLGTGSINFNGGTLEILAAGGGIVSNKPINLGEVGGTLLADANTKSTFAGIISGFSGLVKDGAGEVILTAANTYTGGTTVVAGTLQLGDGGTSGSIVGNVVDNGNLTFNRSDAVTFEGIISGTGSIAQSGTGTTILTADRPIQAARRLPLERCKSEMEEQPEVLLDLSLITGL